MAKGQIRIKDSNLSVLKRLQLRGSKAGLALSLAQLANQAIALGLKAAKEHKP